MIIKYNNFTLEKLRAEYLFYLNIENFMGKIPNKDLDELCRQINQV